MRNGRSWSVFTVQRSTPQVAVVLALLDVECTPAKTTRATASTTTRTQRVTMTF
jgi:hypothetical protein